jgi:hypothetical protein
MRVRDGPARRVRALARRLRKAVRQPDQAARPCPEDSSQLPARKRRSCPSQFGPKREGRGRQLGPQARRSEQGSADRSCARLKLGRAADLWSGMTRDGKPCLVQAQNVEPSDLKLHARQTAQPRAGRHDSDALRQERPNHYVPHAASHWWTRREARRPARTYYIQHVGALSRGPLRKLFRRAGQI